MWLGQDVTLCLVLSMTSVTLGQNATTPDIARLTQESLAWLKRTHYNTSGSVIDFRVRSSFSKLTSVRISTPFIRRRTNVTYTFSYESIQGNLTTQLQKINVAMAKRSMYTMIEWASAQSTYNVSVLPEYKIRDVLLNASELIAPKVKTSLCSSHCLDYEYEGAPRTLRLWVISRRYGFASVGVKVLSLPKLCLSQTVISAEVRYATTSGQRGYVLFTDTDLTKFALSNIEHQSWMKLQVRFSCNTKSGVRQSPYLAGLIHIADTGIHKTTSNAVEVMYDDNSLKIQIAMPLLNRFDMVWYEIRICPTNTTDRKIPCRRKLLRREGIARVTSFVNKVTPGVYDIHIRPEYLIGTNAITTNNISFTSVPLSTCDRACLNKLVSTRPKEIYVGKISLSLTAQKNLVIIAPFAFWNCALEKTRSIVQYGNHNGQYGEIYLNPLPRKFEMPTIQLATTYFVRITSICESNGPIIYGTGVINLRATKQGKNYSTPMSSMPMSSMPMSSMPMSSMPMSSMPMSSMPMSSTPLPSTSKAAR
ncbi:uncharacterized protein LOC111261752 isoform X1 [Varroa jacobsoni]|uniref:uncharacterized protein LOC111261752 isoform X1 n=1 Tax=Varroa jacobsoni TaxID=62625 RepID=UPI000BF9370D|nr:uncharacterized protein LOC111261752 isoform X1 [Varroa jacobsoni]XP_022691211.1 uncharacterized protein LOC111261752 isoform X1 [Varroa jacobsoni]XP_022691212.1 uncharacterized protein LOC111261752 isoform X1 [Varroa jacobsoni]XP_022691213.1 uncharacterized protein LOC111261752 isoform X1 [Varroa jacobsoni]